MWGPRGPTVFALLQFPLFYFWAKPETIIGKCSRRSLARSPPQNVIDDEEPRISPSSEILREVEGQEITLSLGAIFFHHVF